MDIVERLRKHSDYAITYSLTDSRDMASKAIDEIERLRAALGDIYECFCTSPNCNAIQVSSKALKPPVYAESCEASRADEANAKKNAALRKLVDSAKQHQDNQS